MLNKNNVNTIIAELKKLSKSNINKEVELLANVLGYSKEDLQELKEECRNNILELRRELKNEFSQEVIFLNMEQEQETQENKSALSNSNILTVEALDNMELTKEEFKQLKQNNNIINFNIIAGVNYYEVDATLKDNTEITFYVI